jgi:hypothetical protein
MKFRLDKKAPVNRADWHHWVAWHPVRSGPYLYWLCWLDRKGQHFDDSMGGCWVYEYRELCIYP